MLESVFQGGMAGLQYRFVQEGWLVSVDNSSGAVVCQGPQ